MRATLESAGEDSVGRATAVGRIGSPRDAAGIALFLSSRAGEFLTGSTLVFDGGALRLPRGALYASTPHANFAKKAVALSEEASKL